MALAWPAARDYAMVCGSWTCAVDVKSAVGAIAHSAQHAPTWHFCMSVYEPVLGCIVELDSDLRLNGHPTLIYLNVV